VILEVFVKISPILMPPIEVARFKIDGSIAPVLSSNKTLPAKMPASLVEALPKPKLVLALALATLLPAISLKD